MAFKRIPLGSETGGWGGESSRCGRVARVGGLSTGRFAIRNEFQDEVAWSLLAWCPPTQLPGHLAALGSRAPHGPGATGLSGHPHSSGRHVDAVLRSNRPRAL